MNDPEEGFPPPPPTEPEVAAPRPRSEAAAPGGRPSARPSLSVERAPVLREQGGYLFQLEPPDLANLRELPNARGKSDEELGKEFLEAYGDRLVAAIADDLPAPASIRVLVDPYSRQAFLALGNRVRGIVSF
jgi:hypothetical protein